MNNEYFLSLVVSRWSLVDGRDTIPTQGTKGFLSPQWARLFRAMMREKCTEGTEGVTTNSSHFPMMRDIMLHEDVRIDFSEAAELIECRLEFLVGCLSRVFELLEIGGVGAIHIR